MISQGISKQRRLRSCSGSVTVEASISMVLFIFALVSILSAINICRLQRRIGQALNSTALDISRYSYFYYVTGGYDATRYVMGTTSELLQGLGEKESPGVELKTLAELTDVLFGESPGAAEANYTGSENTYNNCSEDPISLLLSLLSEGIESHVSGLVAEPIVKAAFHSNLSLSDTETDEYLKSHGVVGGWSGLDFEMSRLYPEESPCDVSLAVSYSIRIPFVRGVSLPVVQRAVTGSWLGGDRTVITGNGSFSLEDYYNGSYSNSIWRLSAFDRGRLFREVFSQKYSSFDAIDGMHGVIGYDPISNTYLNCVSINTFSESYNSDGFQAAKACEHTIRKLKLTISEVMDRLHEGDRASVAYTVIIPEDARDEVYNGIYQYLAIKGGEFHSRYPSVDISFEIVKAGGNANK